MGRDLPQLHQQLQTENQVGIFALSGIGGIGKTELALQYALNYQNEYPGGLCWLEARGENVGSQLLSFARIHLNLQIPEGLTFEQQIGYCWRNWVEGKALIIFDDVQKYGDIKPYLPPSTPKFKVLLTSRKRLGNNVYSLPLAVLTPEAALELLQSLVIPFSQSHAIHRSPQPPLVRGAKDGRISAELEQAQRLCQELGYLPLAIELVGRYLDKFPTRTIYQVRRQLDSLRLAAAALCKHPEDDDDMNAKLGVAAAFELSWTILSPQAQRLGCRLSLLAATPFKWEWVEAAFGENDGDELYGLHLLSGGENRLFSLHPLIREFFAMKLSELPEREIEEDKRPFCRVMVAEAKKIPETLTVDDVVRVGVVIPHLEVAAKNLIDAVEDEDLFWIFTGLGRYYEQQGLYKEAEPWFETCLEVVRTRLGENHPDVAGSLNNLALLYHSQGRYSEAEPLYQQALKLTQQLHGENHPDVAGSLNNLAALYHSQGRYDKAERLFQQVLKLTQQLYGENHSHVATSLNNLALLYDSQGRYSDAERLFQKALELRQQLLGDNHLHVAASLNNLAKIYHSQGRYIEAKPLYQKALKLLQQLLGDNHPHVAQSLNNLASLYDSQGRYTEAEPLFLQALKLKRQLLGDNHPDVAQSLNNLAELYRSQGRYTEAEPLYQQALKLRQQLLGDNHPHVAQSLNNLAQLYSSQGRYADAEPLHQEALALLRKLYGDNHPDVAHSLNNLALLYNAQGDYIQAEALSQQALIIYQQTLGNEHPHTQNALLTVKMLRMQSLLHCDTETLFSFLQALAQRAEIPQFNTEVALAMLEALENNPDLLSEVRGAFVNHHVNRQALSLSRRRRVGPLRRVLGLINLALVWLRGVWRSFWGRR